MEGRGKGSPRSVGISLRALAALVRSIEGREPKGRVGSNMLSPSQVLCYVLKVLQRSYSSSQDGGGEVPRATEHM